MATGRTIGYRYCRPIRHNRHCRYNRSKGKHAAFPDCQSLTFLILPVEGCRSRTYTLLNKRSDNNGDFIDSGLRIFSTDSFISSDLPYLRQQRQCQGKYRTVLFQRLHRTRLLYLCIMWTAKINGIVLLPNVFGKQQSGAVNYVPQHCR